MKIQEETLEYIEWQIRQCILEINHDFTYNEINEQTLDNAYKMVYYIEKHLGWHKTKE